MRRVNFDMDVLRTFVTGIELGSFAKAAKRLGRSTSAVSAQLKKLEDQAGTPVLRRSGRGMEPTPAGETLLSYARRLLALNDEAATAMHDADLEGWIRLGMQEDFGEAMLTDTLGRFARAHPRVRIETRITRNNELLELVARGQLDLALTWDWDAATATPHSKVVAELPLRWIGPADDTAYAKPEAEQTLPLVMLSTTPCVMRQAATAALDHAGIPWRVAFTSSSLSGIWAAIAAGLGLSVRTSLGLPTHVRPLTLGEFGLPNLPRIGLRLHRTEASPSPAAQRLETIVLEALREVLHTVESTQHPALRPPQSSQENTWPLNEASSSMLPNRPTSARD
ncbi:MAG: LysR substrate-binding domain-containing protein [Acidihalobacter sp.]|uniref:LysR substrate-binding domain-containing protein n=1 Tax=Acidihalobacter sp. TaxID=1872108 RepID=UPI00307D44F8